MRIFNTWCYVLLCWMQAVGLVLAQPEETPIAIPNGDFESGTAQWRIEETEGMTTVTAEMAASGKYALKIVDTSDKRGSSAFSEAIPIPAGKLLTLRGRCRGVSGRGVGVYVRILDKDGQWLKKTGSYSTGADYRLGNWNAFEIPIYPVDGGVYLTIWIHSYDKSVVTAYLDDLTLVAVEGDPMARPWKAQYKLRPDEKGRLTAADVAGPDGIVYPDWRHCGVPGGIPDVGDVFSVADFGGRPDDGRDDAEAIERACRAAGERGGGGVRLEAGVYHLDRPITIRRSGVTLRGRGADRTKIIFRYALPGEGIRFFGLEAGARVGPATLIDLHAQPEGLTELSVSIGETVLFRFENTLFVERLFNERRRASKFFGKVAEGPQELVGVAKYSDGSQRVTRLPIVLDRAHEGAEDVPDPRGAIVFLGGDPLKPNRLLTRDGARGGMTVFLDSTAGIGAGDRVRIVGPATERWKKITRNKCPWGNYRMMDAVAVAVTSDSITLNQPLRIEYPVVDGSYVQALRPIRRCGIEDLSIEQTTRMWITSVLFAEAWECWAQRVNVTKCGRNPVYATRAKWCEVRDCVFDGAWYNTGACAYVGWENSWDCLMENVTTYKMRHAPVFQWASSGCVIRDSAFHDSDGQWHAGWTNENLMENCTIDSRHEYGSYGYGMWASPPEDTGHGPNGPRNVVYNCRVKSEKAGVWLGGMNENWLFLYNRFEAASGAGFECKSWSVDHILRGNAFVLQDKDAPMVLLRSPDCVGIELVDNVLYGGNGCIFGGMGKPEVERGNRAEALESVGKGESGLATPSIYRWQKEHAAGR